MLGFNAYQQEALSRLGSMSDLEALKATAMGLAGETGEYIDRLKKSIYHGQPLNPEKLGLELGDVLWYLSVAASKLGFSLEEIAEMNLTKLRKRYPHGFSPEASRARADLADADSGSR